METKQADARLVAGRYLLQEPLGRGGMGTVWRAQDQTLQRQVAVKEVVLPAGVSPGERSSFMERALREARAAARLNHPGVVAVYDVVKDDGQVHIVMELVEAPTLGDLIERGGALSPERAAGIGLGVLAALEHAHSQGIVHRDVKPANVMVTAGDRAKLSDFGIASVTGDPKLTASGMILGSPAYMAPEQANERDTGPATDIWSLGATLFYAVEGTPPFDRDGAIPTLTAVLHEDIQPSDRSGPLLPALQACLQKDPQLRPSHPELRALLEQAGGGALAPAATTMGATETATRTEVAGATEPLDEDLYDGSGVSTETAPAPLEGRPKRSLAGALTIGGLLIAALVALLVWNAGRDALPPQDTVQEDAQGAQGDGDNGSDRGESAEGAGGGGDVEGSGVPDGWTSYTDEAGGYTIAYPEGWEIREGRYAAQKDFTDPSTGSYMRVEWTDQPGDDVAGRLEEISASLAGRVADYEQISLEPTTYRDYDAALSEYTYRSGDAQLHAYNLQFVTGGYGFALNFQTNESNWDDHQSYFETFKETFQPPS